MTGLNFKYSFLMLSASIFSLLSCVQPKNNHSEDLLTSTKLLTIKFPDQLIKPKIIDSQKIFESIGYIPLETTQTSRFSEINQLEVTQNHLVVLDRGTSAILVFLKNGKFQFKITASSIREFSINEVTDQIVFQDNYLGQTFRYDFTGKLLEAWTTPFVHSAHVFVDSTHRAFYRYFVDKRDVGKFSNSNIVISDQAGAISNGFLSYDTSAINFREVLNPDKQFYKSNGTTYFIQPYVNRIYRIESDKLIADFNLNFEEKYKLPDSFLTDKRYLRHRLDYFQDNPQKIALVRDFYIVDSMLAFKALASNWYDIILYDLKTRESLSAYQLGSSPANNNLPLGTSFIAADTTSFYRFVAAKDL